MNTVWVGGKKIALDPRRVVGIGGEADVYELPGDRALKVWRTADDRREQKLGQMPRLLPPRVIAPLEPATDGTGRLAGYTMRLLRPAEPLLALSERAGREAAGGAPAAVAFFRDIHQTVTALHRSGIVIGDFNDLNVLLSAGAPWFIDADSYQFGGWPCPAFTERFVDPRLCDGRLASPVLARPYDAAADWFAFAALLTQSLLFVGPWGGVHPSVKAGRRSLERVSVFRPDVRYPKPAAPFTALPDELLHQLHLVFEKDARGPFPAVLLEALRFARCPSCGLEHARAGCPRCAPGLASAPALAVIVRGSVRARPVPVPPPPPATVHVEERGGQLLRRTALGLEHVGEVLANQTRFWVGPTFGFGFYRAGALSMAFVFDAARGRLKDGVALPAIHGHLTSARCVFTEERAWFFWTTRQGGRAVHACALIERDGAVTATAEGPVDDGDTDWLATEGTPCGAGAQLFVPTDDGLVRVEARGSRLTATRRFPDTELFVTAASRLSVANGGLLSTDERGAFLLEMGA